MESEFSPSKAPNVSCQQPVVINMAHVRLSEPGDYFISSPGLFPGFAQATRDGLNATWSNRDFNARHQAGETCPTLGLARGFTGDFSGEKPSPSWRHWHFHCD
jgi:hypothetical protein